MSSCPRCGSTIIPMCSFRCSHGLFDGRILCQGCFRQEEYDEAGKGKYTQFTSPKGPDEVWER